MAINNIEQVKWIVHKILPAVYDEALSYYEVLCKVIAKLNEVIANEDAQNEMLVGFDERLTDVEEAVSEIESDIREEITDVLKTYNGYANGKFLGVSGDEIKWVNMPTVITSYDSLTDKPQINGITLAGNKTSAQLDIKQIPAGGVVGQVLKKLSDNDYDVAWGSSGGGGGGGTTDYTDLENKPQINGVTLAGNKSTADLSLGDMKKADYDSDSAVDDAGGIAAYVGSAIGTATSELMGEADYDNDEIVKDAGGIVPYVESKVVASVVQNFPEDSQFDVVMDNADNGEVASTVIFGKTLAVNQQAQAYGRTHSSGVVFTVNSDGFAVMNGTASSSDSSATIGINNADSISGHVYYLKGGTSSQRVYYKLPTESSYTDILDGVIKTGTGGVFSFVTGIVSGTTYTNVVVPVNKIDLTLCGFTSAETTDVATLKTAWLKKYGTPLPQDIPYDNGSLANVNGEYRLRGRNIFDEEMESGVINNDGSKSADGARIRSKNYIPVKPNTTYYYRQRAVVGTGRAAFYDANKQFVYYYGSFIPNATFTTPDNACYMLFSPGVNYGTTYTYDITINESDASINGQYFPYYNGGTIDCSAAPLNGVGTAQDEVDYATGERTTRVSAIVDLSTLSWNSAEYGWNSTDIANLVKAPSSNDTIANILSSNHIATTRNSIVNLVVVGDYVAIGTNGNLFCSSTASPTGYLCYELATPVITTETPQPVYTQKGYNVLEPISGDVQSGNVNTTYLHLLGDLFARKADLVNGKVPDSQLPDFGEANVINFDSIVSGTTTIPSDDRTKLSDMTKPCEIHIGTAVYHRATPFKFYWEQKGTVLNVVKILEINSSTYIITETTMFASYATTSTNKGIPETGTNGVWKLVANKTVASDSANTGFTYTELLGGSYDEYMVVVKGKAKGNVSILNTNSGGTSLSNTITYREGASASISNNQSAIPATNGNYFEATLTLKNYISFGSGNGGYFALDGNVCDGDSSTQSTYFIQCAWKIAYAGTYAIGFNNLAKDSEIRLYGRNTGDYVFPNSL